jgi:hypothetical protein
MLWPCEPVGQFCNSPYRDLDVRRRRMPYMPALREEATRSAGARVPGVSRSAAWRRRAHCAARYSKMPGPGEDFGPAVTGVVSQPSWLRWRGQASTRVSHVPDFFARRDGGWPR